MEIIRLIEKGEIPLAADVIRESFATVAAEFGLTEENCPRHTAFSTTAERLERFYGSGALMYGLFSDGRLAGYAALTRDDGAFELHNLAVLPEFRHRGYGVRLLAFCIEKAAELGGEKIALSIIEENTALKNWYAKKGFIHTGTRRFEFFPFTVGYMERALQRKSPARKDIYEQVEQNIDDLAEKNVGFSIPVTHQEIMDFKNKVLPARMFMPPLEWLPNDIENKKILLLAGAGGQQAPLFAAIGADVTVFDISEKMLNKDRVTAARENLIIHVEKGNMCDLSRFESEAFDLIINPPSLFYVPDVIPVFRECHRILKRGGVFIMNAPNPINYICDFDNKKKLYIARNKLPYISYEHDDQGNWIEFGHTLESYIGGQIECGFSIIGFYEESGEDLCDASFVTRAKKN